MGQVNQMQAGAPKRSLGPIIGIIVVVALLIIGGLYFWGEKLSTTSTPAQENPSLPPVTSGTQPAGDAAQGAPVSGADDIDTLNSELQTSGSGNVDLSGLE
jgi:hypothetical protein